ncbi:MAG TPA: ATP synthase F1 subunit epsilon [Acidimicrobiales bacterium]|nr:ATP synthase F1 subunit epsilon [Acidimicrobiales bacterium]
MPTFPARLVTPEQVLLEEDVAAVILRTDVGDATFMPGHTRLIGAIVPGPVRFQREDGTEEVAAVHGGFVQVDPSLVVVLAPVAERAADIDLERARRALEAAAEEQGPLEQAEAGEQPVTSAAGARRRAEVRIEVAEGRSA